VTRLSGQPLVSHQHLGLELINKTCWKCERQIFCVTGVVTTSWEFAEWDRSTWDSGDWVPLDFYALYQFEDTVARQVASHVETLSSSVSAELAHRGMQIAQIENRYIKNAELHLWTSVCRGCKMHDGPSKLIENERSPLMANWAENRRLRRLVYRSIELSFDSPQSTYAEIKSASIIDGILEGR